MQIRTAEERLLSCLLKFREAGISAYPAKYMLTDVSVILLKLVQCPTVRHVEFSFSLAEC